MITFRLIGAYRVDVEKPVSHVHVIAVGTVEEFSAKKAPTMSWTAQDLKREKETSRFVVGPIGGSVPTEIAPAQCESCGEPVVRIYPLDVERQLQECVIR